MHGTRESFLAKSLTGSSRCCNSDNKTGNSAALSVHLPVDREISCKRCNCKLPAARISAKQLAELRMPMLQRSGRGRGRGEVGTSANGQFRTVNNGDRLVGVTLWALAVR